MQLLAWIAAYVPVPALTAGLCAAVLLFWMLNMLGVLLDKAEAAIKIDYLKRSASGAMVPGAPLFSCAPCAAGVALRYPLPVPPPSTRMAWMVRKEVICNQ